MPDRTPTFRADIEKLLRLSRIRQSFLTFCESYSSAKMSRIIYTRSALANPSSENLESAGDYPVVLLAETTS
jgi:hypothetical protein